MSKITYRPEIDGLRAVAVLAVILYHAGLGLTGGYVGVDVFFVVSGFLITSLILHEIEEGTFRLLGFWERRVRRILPALVLVVLCCLGVGWFMLFPGDFDKLGESVAAQGVLMSNFYFWKETGYFTPTQFQPLLHTWSLAVEEQFYLLFPWLLLLVIRYKRRAVGWTLGGVALLSLALSVYGTYARPEAAFYLLPFRAWELSLGALLAIRPAGGMRVRWLREVAGLAGLAAILFAASVYTIDTRFPGVAALAPCLGTAAIIWSNEPERTSLGRILAWRPIVFIGLISYSLYLWHWPVLIFLGYWAPATLAVSAKIAGIAAAFVLSILSWRFVEAPFRRRVIFSSRRRILAFGLGSLATLLVIGILIHAGDGFSGRWRPEALQYLAGHDDKDFRDELDIGDIRQGRLTELGLHGSGRPVDLLVWGDSHAMAVLHVLDRLCTEYHVRGLAATHSSTGPLLDYPGTSKYSLRERAPAYNRAVLDFAIAHHVKIVLLAATWNLYLPPTANERAKEIFRHALLKTIGELRKTATKIYLLEDVPHQDFDVPRYLAITAERGQDPSQLGISVDEDLEKKAYVDELFTKISDSVVRVLDPEPYLTNAVGFCPAERNGHALYFDTGHLTIHGEMQLRPLFKQMFQPVAPVAVRAAAKG